jgi:hypothetical protein
MARELETGPQNCPLEQLSVVKSAISDLSIALSEAMASTEQARELDHGRLRSAATRVYGCVYKAEAWQAVRHPGHTGACIGPRERVPARVSLLVLEREMSSPKTRLTHFPIPHPPLRRWTGHLDPS